jgi:hypothetical protein
VKQHTEAISHIDNMIQNIPDQMDTLLDMRLALMNQGEPGHCISAYFHLKKHLSGWYLKQLHTLRDLLETRIQIEIVIHDAQERKNACLALGENHTLEDYCQEQMRQIALQNKDSEHIHMRFSWA